MNKLRNWIICIGSVTEDLAMIRWASKLAKVFAPDQITLLHISEDESIPDYILKNVSDIRTTQDSYTQDMLNRVGTEYFSSISCRSEILSGDILSEILKFSFHEGCDLIFIGNNAVSTSQLTRKVVRKSHCSVMVVPNLSTQEIAQASIFTDFSEHSDVAFRIGSKLFSHLQIEKVKAVHLYNDASRFMIESPESPYDAMLLKDKRTRLNDRLKQLSLHKMQKNINKYAAEIEGEVIPSGSTNQRSAQLVQWARENNTEMIIMGSKGVRSGVATLLGSVTENICAQLSDKILFIVKIKNENRGFLSSIFSS